ncbi:hypothetical protein GYMLUDRAFT_45909 [Collybiopsis luxurians FD-317 M1]|uniref:Replication protein A C-terminal domain-containing protein n=1 Tax=Collybiopsis luxurians FD-317 M1 TaxID=944289 RepID=A0A0D0B397_9AGAR|nr:hypothetical protein GYMLUDRAFT_45909 [Collybiopsis luxurians FD-317 M1]
MSSDTDSTENSGDDIRSRLLASGAKYSVRHVSIAQLLKAVLLYEGALFQIEGREFKKIIIVANVIDKKETDTQIAYRLDDGTGKIWARIWQDPHSLRVDPLKDKPIPGPSGCVFELFQAENDQSTLVSELHYVRATGELSEYKTASSRSRSLILYGDGAIEYIQGSNEVDHHFLQIIKETHIFRVGPPPIGLISSTPSAISNSLQRLELQSDLQPVSDPDPAEEEEFNRTGNAVDSESVFDTPTKVRNTRALEPPSPTPRPKRQKRVALEENAEAGSSRLPAQSSFTTTDSKPEDLVLLVIGEGLNALRQDQPDSVYEGVARKLIVYQVRKLSRISSHQVNEAIAQLLDSGMICETVDRDHFDLVD